MQETCVNKRFAYANFNAADQGDESSKAAEKSSDEDNPAEPDTNAAASIAQGTDRAPSAVKSFLDTLPLKWRNVLIRTCMAILMISGFSLLVYFGPLALVFLVLILQLMCFHEIIRIGHVVYRSQELPWFRSLSWFFLFTSNYYLFGESLIDNFRVLLSKEDFLQPLMTHHRFISFCLYCGGVVAFVLSLKKKHYLKQFTLFGWTHMTLLIIVTSSHFVMYNIFNGVIWFLVPVSMIICNDIGAYLFGFFLGKTPLIKLSPRKTWEGFIGGGVATLIFGVLFSLLLIPHDMFVCPIEYDDAKGAISMDCVRNPIFQPVQYKVPSWMLLVPLHHVTWYPYMSHCLIIAVFCSVVAPFGGFFASGFKRAFKIKDFGDAIPGHGGIVDRIDCQVLMGAFVYLYYNSFIRQLSPNHLLHQILVMPPSEQLDFYRLLTEGLIRRGVLPNPP